MDNNGFIYIFSNVEYAGLIKIGKSKSNPIIRADQLSRNTGAIGTFVLEWSKEVPAMDIAERFLHYIFRHFHYTKEYYKVDIQEAIAVVNSTLDNFFAIDNKTQASWNQQMKVDINKQEIENLEEEFIELEEDLKNLF